jgi:KAT8 regulatory NSL complex subunit 2
LTVIASQPTRVPSPPPNRAFDFCSDAESDADSATVETAWRGDADSDADSVDSEMENPLKHAGAYSAEEVIRIMRDKLIRLQKLYIDQFQRLQYLLKEERRQYRVSLRKEHEAELMSIQRQPNEGLEDRIAYDQLKALNHYNRPSGNEAVLHGKLMERRVRLSEANSNLIASNLVNLAGKLSTSSATVPKCSFNITSSVKCGEICIPMTKFCQKHILSDPNQVLFRQCGFVVTSDDEQHTDDGPCETPIPDVLDSSTCVYHNQLQPAFPTLSIELNTLARADQQYTNSVRKHIFFPRS